MIIACEHEPLSAPVPLLTVEHPNCSTPLLSVCAGSCRHQGQTCVLVELCGELDAYSATNVIHVIRWVELGDQSTVIDLSAVSFIDGAGWRVIEELDELMAARGGRVWLHDPSRVVQRLAAILDHDRNDICAPPARHEDPEHPAEPTLTQQQIHSSAGPTRDLDATCQASQKVPRTGTASSILVLGPGR